MRKIIISLFLLAGLVVGAAGFSIFYAYREMAILNVSQAKKDAADLTHAIMTARDGPEKWDMAVFVPADLTTKFLSAIEGTEFVSLYEPGNDPMIPQGYIVVRVDKASISHSEGFIEVDLDATALYRADQGKPWWGDAQVRVIINAAVVPVLDSRGIPELKILPLNLRPVMSWSGMSIGAGPLLGQITADGVLLANFEDLRLRLPSVEEYLPIDMKMDVETVDLEEGEFQYHVQIPDIEMSLNTMEAYPVITRDGIWLLSDLRGKDGSSEDPPNLNNPSGQEASAFRPDTNSLFAMVNNRVFSSLIGKINAPISEEVKGWTEGGIIAKAFSYRDDHLGSGSLSLHTRGVEFIKGKLDITPNLKWDGGIRGSVSAAVSANVATNLEAHLTALGYSDDWDIDFGIHTRANLRVVGDIGIFEGQNGRAIFSRVDLACEQMKVVLEHKGGLERLGIPWLEVRNLGVNYYQNIGGGKPSGSILLDDTFTHYSFGPGRDDRYQFIYNHPSAGVGVRVLPQEIIHGDNGLILNVGYEVIRAEAEEIDRINDGRRYDIRSEFEGTLHNVKCPDPKGIEVNFIVEGLPVAKVMENLAIIYKTTKRLPQEAIKEVEKFFKYPIRTFEELDENIIREGKAAIDRIIIEAGGFRKWLEGRTGIKIDWPDVDIDIDWPKIKW